LNIPKDFEGGPNLLDLTFFYLLFYSISIAERPGIGCHVFYYFLFAQTVGSSYRIKQQSLLANIDRDKPNRHP
jgi:hypothetical protein